MKTLRPKKLHIPTPCASAAVTGYAPIIALPTDAPEQSIAEIRAAGYIPVLTDNPEKLRVILPQENVAGGDMLMAAIHGLVAGGYSAPMERFVKELYARMVKREGACAELCRESPNRQQ